MHCEVRPGGRYAAERRGTGAGECVGQLGAADEVAVETALAGDVEVTADDNRTGQRVDDVGDVGECCELLTVHPVEAIRL